MSHDSAMISIDKIKLLYPTRRRFNAYVVVVTSDTNGTVDVYESPLNYPVLHRPASDRPATIDFAGTGFPVHVSVGNVPTLVRYDVFLVRDRKAVRRAGEILQTISNSDGLSSTIEVAKAALLAAAGGPTTLLMTAVAAAVAPVLKLIGEILESTPDRVLEACAGSQLFTPAFMQTAGTLEALQSPTNNIETTVEVTIFDSQRNEGDEELEELRSLIVEPTREHDVGMTASRVEGARAPASLVVHL